MLRWKSSLKPADSGGGGSTGITLEASATTTAVSYATPTNIDVNIPAVSTDDILLLLVATGDVSDPTTSPPSGWTKITEQDGASSSQSTTAAYWKRASSGSTATTETWSSFFPYGEYYYIWVGAYSGCVTSVSPVDAYGSSATNYGTPWSVNVTTNTSNAMIVAISGSAQSTITSTWSDGTELIDTAYPGTAASVSINEKLESSAGSKTRTVTPSATTGNSMVAVALKPASVGSTFPSTSLVGFYKLGEASGADAADSSGNGRTFSDNGTVASTTGTIGGETVNVRTLDRPAGKYFSRTDDANFDVGDGEDFTISFWAKVSSSMGNYDTGGIFSKRHNVLASDAGYQICLRKVNSTTYVRYNAVCDGTTTLGDTNTDTGIATDAWAHYMMVFTADATLITYVNNAQYSSVDVSSVTGALTNTKDNYIGQLAYNNNGSIIADVTHLGFWSIALDSSERTALYNSGKVLAPAAPSGPSGDALILNGVTNNSTGGVETSMRTDGSSTVYGSYAIGNMDFRDGTKNGVWTDDGLGCFFDQSTAGTDWQTLLGTGGGTFSVYEQGTSTLIFSFAWTGEQNWTGNIRQYGQTTKDYTGTVPANSTRIDVYHETA